MMLLLLPILVSKGDLPDHWVDVLMCTAAKSILGLARNKSLASTTMLFFCLEDEDNIISIFSSLSNLFQILFAITVTPLHGKVSDDLPMYSVWDINIIFIWVEENWLFSADIFLHILVLSLCHMGGYLMTFLCICGVGSLTSHSWWILNVTT